MKNKKSLYLLALSVVVFTIIIGKNMDRIKFSLSLFDIYREAKTVENIETPITKVPVENPLDKVFEEEKIVDSIDESEDNPSNTDINEIAEKQEEITTPSTSIPNNAIIEEKKSLNIITAEYNKKFKALEVEFESNLDSLLQTAYSDYVSGVISKSKLASKYLDEGANLEKSADRQFYALLKEFEDELKENSLDSSLVSEVESYYNTFKQGRKTDIINKGMDMVSR